MIFTLTGKDTIIINNIPLNDFANGDIGSIEVPNDLYTMQTGYEGNTIFSLDESGKNANLTTRVLLSSNDDKRLNGLLPNVEDFASNTLLTASITKQIGDGYGNVSYNTFLLAGGMISKLPDIKTSVNGDIEQAVAIYVIRFANGSRSIL